MLVSTRTVAMVAEKQNSYSFASGTAIGAASGNGAGTASGIAAGIGSGSATARDDIRAIAMMTLKGIMFR